jgi:hypothetical protein
MTGQKTFSDWCDQIKSDHAFCVDEKLSFEKFVTDLFVGHFLTSRGCSTINARLHAINHLRNLISSAAQRPTSPLETVGGSASEGAFAAPPIKKEKP